MSYIDRILEQGEKRIYSAQTHWLANARWHLFTANIFGELVVTDRRIIEKTGIIRVQCRSVNLGQIASVTLQQGLWGRILGYGNVLVRDAGGRGIIYRDISNPQKFVNIMTRKAAAVKRDQEDKGQTIFVNPSKLSEVRLEKEA